MRQSAELSSFDCSSLSDSLEVDTGEFDQELPQVLISRLEKVAANLRYAQTRQRFMSFATKFIGHVYNNGRGERSIGWKIINQWVGDVSNRKTQQRYKTLLVRSGMIESGWENYARRYQAPSKYKLTDIAMEALNQQRQEKAKTA